MKQRTKLALLAGAAAMAASAAAAQIVDDYGVEQPETGVTGVGINDAAPPQVTQEGGYVPPDETAERLRDGTLSKDDLLAAEPAARPQAARPGATALTAAQLDDADVLDRSGRELGEVEAVLLGPDGKPAAVLVELEDDVFGRERLVEIDLAELEAQPARKYLNIWSDRIELVTDRPLDWFETARDWNVNPRVSVESASR